MCKNNGIPLNIQFIYGAGTLKYDCTCKQENKLTVGTKIAGGGRARPTHILRQDLFPDY